MNKRPSVVLSSVVRVCALTAISTIVAATAISAQSGPVGNGSAKAEPSKREAKERWERELRARKQFTPEAIKKAQKGPTVVLPMTFHGESEPLSVLSLKQRPVGKGDGQLQETEMEPLVTVPDNAGVNPGPVVESFLQKSPGSVFAPIAGASFEGPGLGVAGFSLTGAPPDTTMAVGPNHIVAWVNSQYVIYNKSGTVLVSPTNGNALFSGVGNGCDTTNRGDPILQYDRLADRWILSQFAFGVSGGNPIAPYLQCFAVSTTNDPTGTYFRYSTTFSSTSPSGFNDYGKLGIWNDGYYTAYNIFGGSPAGGNTGVGLCVSDRTKMLAGNPAATTLCAPITFYASGGGFVPADLDGATLPSDTTRGGIFMRVSFGASGSLRMLRLKPDFVGSTVTITDGFGGGAGSFQSFSVGSTTAPCNGTGGTCVAQPGVAQTLDTLGDRMMYRLSYRNRNGVESLLATHSVDPDGAGIQTAALRWYEIRNPLGNPADPDVSKRPFIYQNSTFNPTTTATRWMGSIAGDKYGNILTGFSKTDTTTALKPSVVVAGRSQCDTLNTLQAEQLAFTGTGSQTGSSLSRWGDYSTVQVDPADDTTFWYIAEYLPADGAFNWHSRIVSYKFPTTSASTSGDFNTAGNWSNGVPSASVTGIVPTGKTMTVNGPTTVCNLDVQSGGSIVMNSSLDITGSLNLANIVDTSASVLGLGCQATVTGASATSYLKGTVRKDFCSTGGFSYPVGSANGYSPVTANVTTLTINPSSLSIQSVQSTRSGMDATKSLKRYWTLASTGALTTDLTFNYLDPTDIAGTEANYLLYKWNGTTSTAVPFTLDTTANTIKATGISSFSDWTAGILAPTAAGVPVSGRVMATGGLGLRNAVVTITDSAGNSRSAITSAFGYYQFDGVAAGDTYTVSVTSKRFQFSPRVVSLSDAVTGLDFTPQ